MVKRVHVSIFILGALLVLAALAVRTESAGSHKATAQTARVAQAVNELEGGCLTCHSALTGASLAVQPLVGHHTSLDQPVMQRDPIALTSSAPAPAKAQLANVGRRILALPDYNSAPRDQITRAFLRTYDNLQAASTERDPQAMQGLLHQISDLEIMLRLAENQASPYRMSRQSVPQPRLVAAALHTAPVMPVTMTVQQPETLDAPAANGWAITDDASLLRIPQDIMFALLRHGPPADASSLDSVLSGRLLSCDMQSPFVLKTVFTQTLACCDQEAFLIQHNILVRSL
jgi:hypothetical protein